MRSTVWRGAMAVGVAAAGIGGWLAGPSGASPQSLGPARMWHGMKIRSLDPVPSQFAKAHSAAVSGVHAASVAPRTTTSTGTTTSTTTTTTTTTTPPTVTTLSNEKTFTRWAYTNAITGIYKDPSSASHRITKTTWFTPDGFPELFLLLEQTKDSAGKVWVKLRIPGRPNGRVGWVPRRAVGSYHLTHQLIVVNRERQRMYLYNKGHKVWSTAVGVGKRSTPTPAGHYWIRERFKLTNPKSGYYPYAFGTTDYSTLSDWEGGGVVGIHGPYFDPKGIPGRISHGCIRLKVGPDGWLAHHIGLGIPLHVV